MPALLFGTLEHLDRQLDQTRSAGEIRFLFLFSFVTAAEAIPGNINPEWRAGVRSSLPEEEDDNSGNSLITHLKFWEILRHYIHH